MSGAEEVVCTRMPSLRYGADFSDIAPRCKAPKGRNFDFETRWPECAKVLQQVGMSMQVEVAVLAHLHEITGVFIEGAVDMTLPPIYYGPHDRLQEILAFKTDFMQWYYRLNQQPFNTWMQRWPRVRADNAAQGWEQPEHWPDFVGYLHLYEEHNQRPEKRIPGAVDMVDALRRYYAQHRSEPVWYLLEGKAWSELFLLRLAQAVEPSVKWRICKFNAYTPVCDCLFAQAFDIAVWLADRTASPEAQFSVLLCSSDAPKPGESVQRFCRSRAFASSSRALALLAEEQLSRESSQLCDDTETVFNTPLQFCPPPDL